VGVTVEGKAGVPLVAEGKISATTELTLSSTQEKTESGTQEWSVDNPVVVPPLSLVVCQSLISTNKSNQDFTAKATITGYVAIWFVNKVDDHWLWFYPIGGVFQDIKNNNLGNTTGYNVLASNAISADATGKVVGGFGVNVVTTYTEKPLVSAEKVVLESVDEAAIITSAKAHEYNYGIIGAE